MKDKMADYRWEEWKAVIIKSAEKKIGN